MKRTLFMLMAMGGACWLLASAVAEMKLGDGLQVDTQPVRFTGASSVVGTNVVPPIAITTNDASNGQVLSLQGGIPTWSSNLYLTVVGNGVTNTPVQTFILYGATNVVSSGSTTEVYFAENTTLVLTQALNILYSGSDFSLVGPRDGSTQYIKGLRAGNYISLDSAPTTPTNVTINANIFPAAVTNSSGTLDWSNGILYAFPLASNTTVTFANATDGKTITVAVIDTNSYTVTWPASVKWTGGTAPTQTTNGTDVITFTKIGSTIYASAVQDLR